ncbi:S-layer family protein [Methanobrevibacter millerae]|uniref:beta strand repeat-containing protein n=1 Tax=Methanobrevibacter millerae TaxID=230361 RepID=UPI0018DD499D|nr:right-handed parallel beta-helix repeat-containing protein [Methanobrevibacter millerae]
MSATCAADANETTIATQEDNQMELTLTDDEIQTNENDNMLTQTEDAEILTSGEGSYSDLRNDINSGGNLTKSHYRYNAGDGDTIEINTPGVINGNGAVIDMAGSNIRTFYVSASGVTIKNLTIKNANYDDNGGAIYFTSSATSGTVSNCNFTNNTATVNGGAVYFNSNGEVTNCNFTDNTASEEGGAVWMSSGTVSNCNFTGNTATRYGGAIYFQGEKYTATVEDCNFKGNSAPSGGAIYFSGSYDTATVTNCNFINNSARYGGAIELNGTGTVSNCNFTGNNANFGGAVWMYSGSVENCNFTGNNAYYGGAVYFDSTGNVSNCNFTGNTATDYGGAVYFADTGEVSNCNFTGSTVSVDGGAVYFESTGNVSNCNFAGNNASIDGGTVFFESTGNVSNCNFTGNTAYYDGGAVYFESTGNVSNCNFNNNKATGDYGVGGGAIRMSSGTVTNCNFTDNSATVNGGAVYFVDSGTVLNCNFTGNNATENGGAIFAGDINILNSTFSNNNAIESGGAVYVENAISNSEINSVFTNNSAFNGGAIYFNGEVNNVTINGDFTGNNAERAGGAIYVHGQSMDNDFSAEFYENNASEASGGAMFFYSLAENNSFEGVFTNNYALYGGGIFFYKKANYNKFNSNFTSNVAKSCGGAMFFYNTTDNNNFTGYFINNSALGEVDETNGNGGAITFKNVSTNSIFTCDFINNTAVKYGGAVNYRETAHNITFNSNFISNNASTGGGVNFFKSFENVIFNGEFIANSAVSGGAIAAGEGIIEDVSFKDNHAEEGGAVYFSDIGTVVNCNFDDNNATRGGAIYFSLSSAGDVINCTFTNNTASSDGGAVYFFGKGNVTDCTFTNNNASSNGGAISIGFGSLTNCNFTDNQARLGGAVHLLNNAEVTNCNFADNQATGEYSSGGAIYFGGNANVTNCNFDGNNATVGSAIYFFGSSYSKTISNSSFLNNKANVDDTAPFNVTISEDNIEIVFMGRDNLLNAIYSPDIVNFSNVAYWGANGIANTDSSNITRSNREAGQNITIVGIVDGNIINVAEVTDENGTIVLDGAADYFIVVRHDEDSYYTAAENMFTNMDLYANVTSLATNNRTVNITAESNIPNEVVGGELLFILPDGTEINATYGDNGTWWAEYTFDEYGEYNVSASHSKLDNLTVSNGTINITKADSIIILDDIVLNYGESINVTIETEGATAITAKIDENDVDVIDNFTIPVYDLNVGNYTLTVTTIADGDHNSVNKTVQITVNRAPTEIILTNETLDLIEGYNSSISADLIPADAGNVTFTSSNSSVVTVDEEGNVNAVGVGSATITVSFAGNDNYAAAENKTVAVTVNEDIVISAPDVSKYYNGAERFVVIVTDSKNNPLANRSVVIGVNGVNYTRTTNDNGTASIAISLVSGQYNVTAAVGNNTVYSTITVLPTVNATDLVKVFRNGTQFYATFKDSQGNYLPDGTMVRFNINGVMYDRKVSGDEGLAKLNINLESGHYIITSMNPITGENAANNVTVISRLIENNDLVKYYRNDSQYTVKVIGDDGNAVGAGETVIFNINGVFYSRTTNESGIAKLNINLPPGDYVITAEYKNCRVSNNIKVLPILSASDLTKQYGTSDQFVATLLDGQGKPYVEQRVQFNVNGVLYNRVTDSSGQAKLSINLPIGQYIITSSYNGSNIANNIVITA